MAFVSERPLPESIAYKSGADGVGPGQYDIDSGIFLAVEEGKM